MTSTIVLPADSTTLILNGRVFNDLAEGDQLELTPVNPKTNRTNSQNAVTIGNRSDGGVHDLVIRVLKNGEDDVYLNSQMNQASPVVFKGSMKTNLQRDDVDVVDTWNLVGGSFTTRPKDTKNSQDGNAMMEYTIQFRDAKRTN